MRSLREHAHRHAGKLLLGRGFALLLVALAALTVVAAIVGLGAGQAIRSIDAQNAIITWLPQLRTIHTQLLRAETGQRGYLLTGHADYLNPYTDAIKNLDGQIAELIKQLPPGTAEHAQLLRVEVLAQRMLAELAATIALYNEGEHVASIELVRHGQGQRQMTELRALIEDMQDRMSLQRDNLSYRVAQGAAQARRWLLIGTAVLVVFAVVALWQIHNQSRRLVHSEQRVRGILAHAGDAFIGADRQGGVTEWNRQAEITFGWSRDEMLGQPFADRIIPPRMRDAHQAGMRAFVQTGVGALVGQRVEITALRKDGGEFPVELSIAATPVGSGFVASAFLRDISERKAAEAKLLASEKRVRTIADNLPVLIAYVDNQQCISFANRTSDVWFGVPSDALIGRHLSDVVAEKIYHDQLPHLQRALGGERVTFDFEWHAMGRPLHLQTTYVPDIGNDGQVCGVYTLSNDVTALKEVERELDRRARFDHLTGLPNRRQFEEALALAVARSIRHGRPLALLFLDVDHFKSINDTHGHQAGDVVLQEFAMRLKLAVRMTDTVARLAGDEFTVILEELHTPQEAEQVAGKIVAALVPPIEITGGSVQVSSSVGVAFCAGGREHCSESRLLALSDQALYEAKRAGRNTYRMLVL
ncbi:MAG TPA: diguanylate cyclase [Burkholderiaceae bacterium]|nr:diguanylate cyclase [Burkholderiaceae bacterium]